LSGLRRPKEYIRVKLSSKLMETWGYFMRENMQINLESQVPVLVKTKYISL